MAPFVWEHAFVRDDEMTEVGVRSATAVRPTTTSVRLLPSLGGVELGVRRTGHKALVFVRFRKLVVAGWWKAPGTAPMVLPPPEAPVGSGDADRNMMHRLWRRFSARLKTGG